MKLEAATRLKASRSQDWYSRMTAEQRAEYLKKYPGTKFHDKTTLATPDEEPYQRPLSGKTSEVLKCQHHT